MEQDMDREELIEGSNQQMVDMWCVARYHQEKVVYVYIKL